MTFDPEKHHRRSIRLRGYDYSQAGAYFVTICAQDHATLFGRVREGKAVLNDPGRMVVSWWEKLAANFPSCKADAFVVMPNHIHGIIVIRDDPAMDGREGGEHMRGRRGGGAHMGAPLRADARPALGRIVQWFKTMSTNAYIRGVDEHGWEPYADRLWQRNYYEHIIRDEEDLSRIREYIENNPRAWEDDPENPTTKRRTEP